MVTAAFGGFSLLLSLLVFGAYIYRAVILSMPTSYDALFFICLLFLLSAALAAFRSYRALSPTILRTAVILICLFDYHFFINRNVRPKSEFDRKMNNEPSQYYREDAVLQFLRSQPGVLRTDFRDLDYPRNVGEVFQPDTVNVYAATVAKEFTDFRAAETDVAGRVADLWNVKSLPDSLASSPGVEFKRGGPNDFTVEVETAEPAWLAVSEKLVSRMDGSC